MKVIEIFRSLQGEGRNQGKPCLFVRLAGCNLNCRWCDTPESRSGGREMAAGAIADEVRRAGIPYVCITGGEPLLQKKDLGFLLRLLKKEGVSVDIETNGTIGFAEMQPHASICMDVKCPSSGEESDLSLIPKLRNGDSVKFVVGDEADCRYTQKVIRTCRIPCEIFVSPVFGTDYATIAKFIIENNLPVRMQLQLHKIIGMK